MNKKLILFIGAGLILASCSSEESSAEEIISTEYTLNSDKSSLWWKGEENADHFHYGHINITEGSLTTQNDVPVAGEFIVDPNTIVAETEGYSPEKLSKLSAHLKDSSFFFIVDYPEIKVSTGAYTDGKLDVVLDILGTKIIDKIPVTVDRSEKGMNMKGEFALDFAKTNMPYITDIDPETGSPSAKSTFQFNLDLYLDKK